MVQSGVHAALSRRRSWVQIPSGTLSENWSSGTRESSVRRDLSRGLRNFCLTWWWNWQTRSAQNAEPSWHWEFESPPGHCRWVGAQPAFIRLVRPVRARDLQLFLQRGTASEVAGRQSVMNPAGVREA